MRVAKVVSDSIIAVYVDFEEEATAKLRTKWEQWGAGVQLVVLPSPYRELTRPLLEYITRLDRQRDDDMITVVLPEFIPAKWWQHIISIERHSVVKPGRAESPTEDIEGRIYGRLVHSRI